VTTREAIAPQLGGGWLETGPCGRPHLRGPAWSWWRCRPCRRVEATRTLRAVDAIRLSLYYPDAPEGPVCGVPSFGASTKRHERAGEDCPLCRQGAARDEQKVRDRRKAAIA
jgi:hypothetical protein